MKIVYSILFCCLATVALGEMAQKYRDYMLNWHNNFRRQHFAKYMNKLEWSDELAQQAEEYVSNCQFDNQYSGQGMNFAYYTDDMDTMGYINRAFNDWSNEMFQYDFSGNDCGSSCRYTQMAWYNTNKVGCAFNKCQQLHAYDTVYDNAWFMGCWYYPYGNNMNGMNGMNGMEYPFQFGQPCSACYEQGMGCEAGLCVESYGGYGMCHDIKPNCMNWAARGDCERNTDYMQKYCPQSCNFCNNDQQWSNYWMNSFNNGECFDHQKCQNYDEQDCYNKPWVMNNCRQMCNLCNNDQQWSNYWMNSFNNGECFDHQKCQNYDEQDCYNKPWVMNNCRQMCNFCNNMEN